MERFATSTWTQTKEIAVVRQFPLAFLAGNINGYRHTLSVCVVYLQRSVLALGEFFLIHQASGSIAKSKESVIILVQRIAVAREGADEQLQLVVSSLTYLNADTPEGILQMVGAFLKIRFHIDSDHKVEVTIDKLLVFSCYQLFYLLDVLYGNLIAWVWKGGMAILLLCQPTHLLLLAWQEDDLVEDYTLCFWNAVHHRHQVHRHTDIVDLDVGIWTDKRRQDNAVHIHQTIYLELPVSDADLVILDIEVVQRNIFARVVLGKILVNIELGFTGRQEA